MTQTQMESRWEDLLRREEEARRDLKRKESAYRKASEALKNLHAEKTMLSGLAEELGLRVIA